MSARDELALAPEQLRRRCDPDSLGFASTAEIEAVDGAAGQERALRAIDFAVEVAQRGYNIFATGPDGTGKRGTVEARLRTHARGRPTPPDVVYLHNFDDPARPLCATLPPGRGRELAHAMTAFVTQAARDVPLAFDSESYQRRRAEAIEPLERERQELLEQLRAFARSHGLDLEITPAGVVTIALDDGRRMTPQEYAQLPDETRREFEAAGRLVEERMASVFPALRELDGRVRERVHALDREVVLFAVGHHIDDVKRAHEETRAVGGWLERVREDVIDNYGGFMPEPDQQGRAAPQLRTVLGRAGDAFRARYEVNVFVAGEGADGAPVVVERNPTFARLFGRIEFETNLGAAVTDHRHIRAGAMHRANGGYLILRASDLLRQPFAWEKLKETLRTGEAQVENFAEALTIFPMATLTPEPIPVDVKVALVASGELYELMHALDEDVRELFRVKAEFDVDMQWGTQEPGQYAAFIASQVVRQGLCHFDAAAVARVVEEGSRRAAHQGKLSTRFQEISDVLTEASHWAVRDGGETVGRAHVERALREQRSRADLVERRLAQMVDEGTLRIDVAGSAVGQLNGLAVVTLGDYAFGHPARITATTAPGGGELVSIDRESKLSGRIHDKGFLILRGYLEHRYGDGVPLSLSASLTFEQSYSTMDGDSASSTELYALLSSLARAPITQGIAVTGSVDQYGNVQAVGGVTEKIEGFFATCERAGLSGEQGVIIPASNQRHLMLDEPVLRAVADGRFHVWTVRTIDEGIELLTGVDAGERREDGSYPEGTIHRRVQERLRAMAATTREWGRPSPAAADAAPEDSNATA